MISVTTRSLLMLAIFFYIAFWSEPPQKPSIMVCDSDQSSWPEDDIGILSGVPVTEAVILSVLTDRIVSVKIIGQYEEIEFLAEAIDGYMPKKNDFVDVGLYTCWSKGEDGNKIKETPMIVVRKAKR